MALHFIPEDGFTRPLAALHPGRERTFR